ncbi:magnesium chelatase ATPase subunit I [Polynucleobacter sp. HIN5]|uniref:magnesium chelatase ATPase subunit I n=1 Tax=Polynucleobacter sp. HIN5 TaxID=3047864 RepID=UPI0025737E11|nr:magnesium chelatase ATPase subunit I [Polynucleobacter sp. HIN5]BEI34014.1 magnesium chelatase ATPase subunit I [Polynucleobacter sp. HIN5]
MTRNYPFSAIVGQEDMKLAILVAALEPSVGGVLVMGDRGTGKSTAVRGLAALLPMMTVVKDCAYGCDPKAMAGLCPICGAGAKAKPKTEQRPVPVIDLPLGATEDRVLGALDIEKALTLGEKAFEPGLLAKANRGFLYIDEVNLLDDHLVDLLIDVAASGQNVVEREGLSVRHPARFVLVGSGNPEEGELRPQLLDRFGLAVEVKTPTDMPSRVEIIKRRDAFERNPEAFMKIWDQEDAKIRVMMASARKKLASVKVDDKLLHDASTLCAHLGTDGLRGELTLLRASRAVAALDGKNKVTRDHLKRIAVPALQHRLRRNPLDESSSATRVQRALDELFS